MKATLDSVGDMQCFVQPSAVLSEKGCILPPIRGYETKPLASSDAAVEPLVDLVPELARMVWTVKKNSRKISGPLIADEIAAVMLYSVEWTPQSNLSIIFSMRH